ncbi:MAG: transposase [Candidatus Omnitrophica bacterium]|nr:transposase [Candidatus Omnitrophota bacterium]
MDDDQYGRPASRPYNIDMIKWFKSITTNQYIQNVKKNNWPPFNKRLWQRSFYDHIIRNDESLCQIQKYIRDNPEKWKQDIYNIANS